MSVPFYHVQTEAESEAQWTAVRAARANAVIRFNGAYYLYRHGRYVGQVFSRRVADRVVAEWGAT